MPRKKKLPTKGAPEVIREGKALFAEKRDKVFELTLDLAINHLKRAA